MKKYRREFWLKQYLNKQNILDWYKAYITFYSGYPKVIPIVRQIKRDFLIGERNEINIIFMNEKDREKVYKFVEKVVNEIEE